MSSVNREPAIARRHPAADLPERPKLTKPDRASVESDGGVVTEKLTAQHNVRIRPATKEGLTRLVDRLRYETGDRSISIASLTDKAIRDYIDEHDE